MTTDLSYPIGRFQKEPNLTDRRRRELIDGIAALPGRMRLAVRNLSAEQLETPYRPEGWTVRQVVHHVADSHLNAYVRFKLALTEHEPLIKPYNQKLWAELNDSLTGPVDPSLSLLQSLHERWTLLLHSLSAKDFLKTFQHPESGILTLDTQIGLYDWHGRHHVAHISSLRARMGW